MLEKERCDLAEYRLQRAQELIKDAETLLGTDSYKSANNRAYYAVFSCMRAVLALDGEDFKKHSGVIRYFQKEYIKTGIFDKKCSDIVMTANTVRNASDYDDFYIASKEDASQQIQNAKELYMLVEKHVKERIEQE